MNGVKTLMLLAAMTALFMGLGYTFGGPGGALIALILAGAMNLFTFWNADRIVLSMHNAREVDGRNAPLLVGIVQQLAGRAGLPMPRVYLIDSPHPNAFATGRDPEHAAVAATTGLLAILDKEEVKAVLAHELGHIRNRDTLIMTMTATIAGAIAMLANFGFFFRDGERSNPLAMIAAMLVAPFAAMPNPVAMRNPAAAALYIVPGGSGDSLFSTHPATANRIAALEQIAVRMGQVGVPRSAVPVTARISRRSSALDPLGPRR